MQRRQGCAWRTDLHTDTGRRVEHPRGHHSHDAGQHLDVDEPTHLAIVGPLDSDATAEQCMPPIMDDSVLPDVGRMDG